MSKLEENLQLPTSTVHQARLQLYQPTRRPLNLKRAIKTPWGSGWVHGKIGQAHADLMESIFKCAKQWRRCEDGSIELLVDPHKVRVMAGGGQRIGGDQFKKLCVELMQVVIEVQSKTGSMMGHLVDQLIESKKPAPLKKGTLNSENRFMWYGKLGPAFVQFIDCDLKLYYDPTRIAALKTGIGQAVARHVITHRNQPNGGWTLDGLIQAVGGGATPKTLRNHREDVNSDLEGLRALGLTLENKKLKMTG